MSTCNHKWRWRTSPLDEAADRLSPFTSGGYTTVRLRKPNSKSWLIKLTELGKWIERLPMRFEMCVNTAPLSTPEMTSTIKWAATHNASPQPWRSRQRRRGRLDLRPTSASWSQLKKLGGRSHCYIKKTWRLHSSQPHHHQQPRWLARLLWPKTSQSFMPTPAARFAPLRAQRTQLQMHTQFKPNQRRGVQVTVRHHLDVLLQ